MNTIQARIIQAREASQVQHFRVLCHQLEENEPTATIVAGGDECFLSTPIGYGRRLGQAIRGNTHVSTLRLDMSRFLDPDVVEPSAIQQATEPLLVYLRNSPALRSLHVAFCQDFPSSLMGESDPHPSTYALGLILEALAVSVCIEELHLGASEFVPANAFVNLMEATTSIHTLDISIVIGDICTTSLPYMCTAFSLNRSLQHLTLDLGQGSDAPEHAILIMSLFTALDNHPVLHDLVVVLTIPKNMTFLSAMAVVLRSTSALNHLSLKGGYFDAAQMECLSQGLRQNKSIRELTWNCDADPDATLHFIQFMQSHDSNNIRALNFGFHNKLVSCFAAPLGEVVAQMLSTGNSSLEVVRFDERRSDLVELFHAIHVSGASNSLRNLEVRKLGVVGWDKLIICLPAMAHLKELIVPPVSQGYLPHLVEALRCNVSLHNLSFWSANLPNGCIYGRRVHAYCQRNTTVSTLLAQLTTALWQPGHMKSGSNTNAKNPSNEITIDPHENKINNHENEECFHDYLVGSLQLLPTLFRSIKPCWRTSTNTVLFALKLAHDSVGPNRDAKRIHFLCSG